MTGRSDELCRGRHGEGVAPAEDDTILRAAATAADSGADDTDVAPVEDAAVPQAAAVDDDADDRPAGG